MDKDVVVDGGSEGGDIGGRVIDNVTVEWDETEEVLIYKFFLGVPKLLVVLVNDCVLVWVVVSGCGTDGGGKELGEESSGNSIRWQFDGKRWERNGWLRSGGIG